MAKPHRLFSIFLFCFPSVASACSCIALPYSDDVKTVVKYKIEKSDSVFIGNVVEKKKIDEYTEAVQFTVIKAYKGVSEGSVTMIQDNCSSPIINKGGQFIIFAPLLGDNKVSSPYTCWEEKADASEATKTIEVLNELLK